MGSRLQVALQVEHVHVVAELLTALALLAAEHDHVLLELRRRVAVPAGRQLSRTRGLDEVPFEVGERDYD